MIQSFRNRDTERVFHRQFVPAFQGFAVSALRRLEKLHDASSLSELSLSNGNRLESLSGNRAGQYSICINASGAFAFGGTMGMLTMLKSWTIIKARCRQNGLPSAGCGRS